LISGGTAVASRIEEPTVNLLARLIMDAYYLTAGTLVLAGGGDRQWLRMLAALLRSTRFWVGYVGKGKSRSRFLDHVAAAFPEMSRARREAVLREFWLVHQLNFLDLFCLRGLSRPTLLNVTSYGGLEHLKEVASTGRGAVVTTIHMGDPRYAHVALPLAGYPVGVLSAGYREMGALARATRLAASRRFHRVGLMSESVGWMARDLAEGKLVFLAVSGYGGRKGIPVRFLGQELLFSSAPARLAVGAGVPIVPVVDLRTPSGEHEVHVAPPRSVPDRSGIGPVTGELVRYFEGIVRDHPGQLDWNWFVIRCQEARGEIEAYVEGAQASQTTGRLMP
jgi:lauroyl/myristoyl acyltransferase